MLECQAFALEDMLLAPDDEEYEWIIKLISY